MPPQLTDTWGAAYIQILIVLIVFAFGIPELIIQMITPEEIRSTISRHIKKCWWYLLLGLICLVSILFFWVLHPCSNYTTNWKSYAAGILMTVILVSTMIVWFIQIKKSPRDSVINKLRKKISKGFVKRGVIKENELIDLIYLGTQGKQGDEKKVVLDSLSKIITNIKNSDNYKGGELNEILKGIGDILTIREKTGSEDNFLQARSILNSFIQEVQYTAIDREYAIKILGDLGISASDLNFECATLSILQSVASNSGQLFRIGLNAFCTNRFDIATAALNKLEALVERNDNITFNESAAYLLGLLAHFWTFNDFTNKRAKSFFARMENQFSPSLEYCIKAAIDYHYDIQNYSTASNLARMKQDTREGFFRSLKKIFKL